MTTFARLFAATVSSRRQLRRASNLLAWAEAGEGDLEGARTLVLAAAVRYGEARARLARAWDAASHALAPLPRAAVSEQDAVYVLIGDPGRLDLDELAVAEELAEALARQPSPIWI